MKRTGIQNSARSYDQRCAPVILDRDGIQLVWHGDRPYEQCRNRYHSGGINAQHFLTCAEQKKDLLVAASFGFASKEVSNEEQQDQIIDHDQRHPRNSRQYALWPGGFKGACGGTGM